MAMITFQPDMVEPDLRSNVETALFLGVRGNPRWNRRNCAGK